jgi:hypothetical protein
MVVWDAWGRLCLLAGKDSTREGRDEGVVEGIEALDVQEVEHSLPFCARDTHMHTDRDTDCQETQRSRETRGSMRVQGAVEGVERQEGL